MVNVEWKRKFTNRGDSLMIVIPKALCDALGIEKGDTGIISTTNEHIEIRKKTEE